MKHKKKKNEEKDVILISLMSINNNIAIAVLQSICVYCSIQ